MKIQKYTNGAWTDLDKPVKKYDTYTDEATSLPLTIEASATDAVDNYQVYGASGGVGEATSGSEPAGYKIPILCQSKIVTSNLFDKDATDTNDGYVDGYHLKNDGTTGSNSSWAISEYMPITGGLNYTFNYGTVSSSPAICYYDSNKQYISGIPYGGQSPKTVSVPQNVSYIRFSFMKSSADDIMFVQANSLPEQYIPHFQQSNYDLFVGDSKLYADEYLDFVEQKVYRYVDGVLTPQDPPTPLPTLTTYIGENNLSVDTTVQPEKVAVEYEGWKGVGDVEKYHNGEWSDNNGT